MSVRFWKGFVVAGTVSIIMLLPLALIAESMFSSNPPDGRTGAPGEGLCTNCHASFPVNSGDGSLEILGVPDTVTAGQTVAVAVQLQDPGQQRWGFA